MAYIYAFAPDAADCSTIGAVGALMDQDARFDLKAGEFGELTFVHPIDPWGKWRALVNGAILKTMVPMRLCPEVASDGGYIASVDVYTVAATASKNARYIYSKADGGAKKKLLKPGDQVTVTGVADAGDANSRFRVKLGKVSGWMAREGLNVERQALPVAADAGGLEAVAASYAVRQQLFRIVSVSPESNGGGRIEVRALRIAYDLLGNLSTYRANGSVTCLEACRGILENTAMPHAFNVYTDIGDSHVGFDARDKNPIEALVGPETGAAARWGAEVVADDYDIYLLRRAGMDRGVRIEYGRNLTGIEVEEDATGVANAVRPRGTDKGGGALYLDGHEVGGRFGYNYDAKKKTCADWLPEGYRFYEPAGGGAGGTVIVRDGFRDGEAPKIAMIEVRDAAAGSGAGEVTAAVARRRLAEAAIARFEAGCDAPTLSMRVDFIMLGDTAEYAQYRHLEPLFIYDTVQIRDRRLGIAARIPLTGIRWRVRDERVAEAEFGAIRDLTASIPGWQVTGLDGGKIAPGSLGASQLADGVIAARHVQAASINAGALQAESVTAFVIEAMTAHINALTAGTITTDQLTASIAHMLEVAAGHINARDIDTDALAAQLADIAVLAAGTATFDRATVSHLVTTAMHLSYGAGQDVYIDNLRVKYAQMVSAAIGSLCIRASDGDYYQIDVSQSGTVTATRTTVTDSEIEAGQTNAGRVILATDITAASLSTGNLLSTYALINKIDAARIDVDQLFARQAFVDQLNTSVIQSQDFIELVVGQVDDSVDDAIKDATPAVLRIDSSRGTVFKDNNVSTVLSVSVHYGKQIIENITALRTAFGASARLQWEWLRMDEDRYGIISADDTRLSDGGFRLTLGPSDVDVKVTFRCALITD